MKKLDDFVVRLHCPKKKCKDTYHSITEIDFSCKDCGADKRIADIYEKGHAHEYIVYCLCHGDEVDDGCTSDIYQLENMISKCNICKTDFRVFSLFSLHAE